MCWRATVPNCISYDPAYAFELAVIIRRGLDGAGTGSCVLLLNTDE